MASGLQKPKEASKESRRTAPTLENDAHTELMKVTILTASLELEGYLHLAKKDKEDRRLTNLLHSDRKFIALTNALVVDRRSGTQDMREYPFIQVSISAIEVIKPHLNE